MNWTLDSVSNSQNNWYSDQKSDSELESNSVPASVVSGERLGSPKEPMIVASDIAERIGLRLKPFAEIVPPNALSLSASLILSVLQSKSMFTAAAYSSYSIYKDSKARIERKLSLTPGDTSIAADINVL